MQIRNAFNIPLIINFLVEFQNYFKVNIPVL